MLKSRKARPPPRDEARGERIEMEIVVDCYNEHEAWSGWQCYLSDRLAFPFTAECIETRRGAPFSAGERVTVTAMFDDDAAADALAPMRVEIEWRGRSLAVPLAQLRGIDVDEDTARSHRGLALLDRSRPLLLAVVRSDRKSATQRT